MTTPRQLAMQQRAQLIALHTETAGHIRTAFGVARQRSAHALHTLANAYGAELARVRDEEDDDTARITPTWLHTHGNLSHVAAIVAESARIAAKQAQQYTQLAQYRAAHDAQHNAPALIALLPGNTMPKRAEIPATIVGYSFYDGDPLSDYFDPLDTLASDAITTAATTAAVAGNSQGMLLAALALAFNAPLQRALVTATSETTGAYRDIVTLTLSINMDMLDGWIWVAQPDACDFCLSMDGTSHAPDEDMESHPWCRCAQVPFRNSVNADDAA